MPKVDLTPDEADLIRRHREMVAARKAKAWKPRPKEKISNAIKTKAFDAIYDEVHDYFDQAMKGEIGDCYANGMNEYVTKFVLDKTLGEKAWELMENEFTM